MPRPQFVPRDHTLPRIREARPVGLNFDTVFRGTREHSKTEGLARLLMPKACERVERLRSMKRARILRERAEEEAAEAEAAAEQSRSNEVLEPVEGPPTVPDAKANNNDDQDNAPSTELAPAAPPSQPPLAPASNTGAVYAGVPPAAPPRPPKHVRFDPDAATGTSAHPTTAGPGAYPPTSQAPAAPSSPLQYLQSPLPTNRMTTPHPILPGADPTTQLPPATEVQAQLNNTNAPQHDGQQHQQGHVAAHYGSVPALPPQYVSPLEYSTVHQYSVTEYHTYRNEFTSHEMGNEEYIYEDRGTGFWQRDWWTAREVRQQQYQQHQQQTHDRRFYPQLVPDMQHENPYQYGNYVFTCVAMPLFDRRL